MGTSPRLTPLSPPPLVGRKSPKVDFAGQPLPEHGRFACHLHIHPNLPLTPPLPTTCVVLLPKGPGPGKTDWGPIGEATQGFPTLPWATHQDPLIGEVLQASVPGGVEDHREGLVRRLHVAEFYLVLGRETERQECPPRCGFSGRGDAPTQGRAGAADVPQDLEGAGRGGGGEVSWDPGQESPRTRALGGSRRHWGDAGSGGASPHLTPPP